MPLTKRCGLAGPDPACSPLAIAVIPGKFMSERIDARGDITIAGGSGDAVRGELTALTRWAAGQAALSTAGAVAHRVSGCAEEFAAVAGIRGSRTTVFTRARRALPS